MAEAPTPSTLVDRGAYVHQTWTVEQGLPVNSVIALAQDAHGYVWLGTYDGLVRFDGVRFSTYNSANTPALPSNRIVALQTTADSSLWMWTESSQLVRLRHGVFTNFDISRGLTGPLTAWHVDAAGHLWVGTANSLGVVKGERIRLHHRRPGSDSVLSIATTKSGIAFAGTFSGTIIRVDERGAQLMPWRRVRYSNHVRGLLTGGDSLEWVVAWSHLWRYNGDSVPLANVGAPYDMKVEPRTGALWMLGNLDVFRVTGNARVERITRRSDAPFTRSGFVIDDSGYVVYGSGGTLLRSGRAFASIIPRGQQSTGPHIITALMQDREGSYWIGTQAAGLHRIKPSTFRVFSEAEGLLDRIVSTVYQDRSGTMWFGGKRSHRLQGERVEVMDTSTGHAVEANTYLETRDGTLWVGGSLGHGLRRCAPGGFRCTRIDEARNARVLAMHQDQSGTLWVGADPDLHRYDGRSWRTVNDLPGAPRAPVRAFAETRDGALWMSTIGEGLVRYAGGVFRRISTADGLPFDHVRGLYADSAGWLWVATEGRGLARLDPREWSGAQQRGRIVSIRSKDGLFDDVVHGIVEDLHGRFWIGSNRGIFWVAHRELRDFADGRTPRIHSTVYTENDGLRNREANGGMQPASIRSRDGRIWFATQDGAAVVDPRLLSSSVPNVLIERVISNGTTVQPTDSRVTLSTTQRDLEIQYTALSFRAPANMQFRYRLEPYDSAWVEAGTRRAAYYTKVPPGKYTFRVLASNSDGVWNDQGAALAIVLPPRIWETLPFRLALLVVAGSAIAALIRRRTRRLDQTARTLAMLVEERTAELRAQSATLARQAEQLRKLDEVKSRFFANVSHEFRTPLTLTIGPLEDLQTSLVHNADATRHATTALRNARRLLRLVNQIMDVARLEAGEMSLQAGCRDIVAFVQGVCSAFASVAESRRITLATTASTVSIDAWFDEDALEKVVANLLSNAVKFTPAGGRIDVSVDEITENGHAFTRIRVADSGPGIPEAQLAHVFDRFYQVDESRTRAQPGTGIGLALTRELVELHSGTVHASARADDAPGALFTVLLPLGREHLRDDQIAQHPVAHEGLSADLKLASTTEHETLPARTVPGGGDVTTILVIDDSAELRAYVREHLEPQYRVVEASDGSTGIAAASELLPDLVISDVMMPGADGTSLCRALRASPDTDFIPVLLLTALTGSDDRIAGWEAGADDYLAKPFEMRELRVRVETLLRSRRKLRERFAQSATLPKERATPPRNESISPNDQQFIDRLFETIDRRLDDPDFGVAELADEMVVDRSYLFRRVRDLQGIAPSDIIRARRLARAANLLTESEATVAEIAYATGFNSVSYFCRCFRDTHGTTPSQHREMCTN